MRVWLWARGGGGSCRVVAARHQRTSTAQQSLGRQWTAWLCAWGFVAGLRDVGGCGRRRHSGVVQVALLAWRPVPLAVGRAGCGLRHWLHGREFAVFGADALLMCVSHALSWVSCLRLLAVSWCSWLDGTGTDLYGSRLIELLQEVAPGETLDADVEEVRAGSLAFCSQSCVSGWLGYGGQVVGRHVWEGEPTALRRSRLVEWPLAGCSPLYPGVCEGAHVGPFLLTLPPTPVPCRCVG